MATYQHGSDPERQAITGLFFADAAAGRALVQHCEQIATHSVLGAFPNAHGCTPIQTYNAGWDGLSDYLPATAHLLTRMGYRPHWRELHLAAPIAQLQTQPCPNQTSLAGLTLRHPPRPPEYHGAQLISVRNDGQEIAVCSHSALTLLTADPAAAQVGYIWWLHVDEAYRRRGIARELMRLALAALAQLGCTDCWLTTTADNWPAQVLYYELGFAVVDASVSFQKSMH